MNPRPSRRRIGLPATRGIVGLFLFLLLWTVLSASASFANQPESPAQIAPLEIHAEYGLDVGYRQDDLDWNIAHPSGSPNILSELTWSELRIAQVRFDGGISFGREHHFFRVQGFAGGGPILDGKNQDSDYAGDDRTGEFSRSNNDAGSGSVFDWNVGGGYEFRSSQGGLLLRAMGGYGENEQNLRMTDGFQTLPPNGPFPLPLHNRYETCWSGPWAGAELEWLPGRRFRLFGSFEHHWADYYAEAEWNLRNDLQQPRSFEQFADGTGIVARGGLEVGLSDRWSVRLAGNWQDWHTDPGLDRLYPSSGGFVESRLNEVNWTSYSVSIGVTLRLSALISDGD